MPMHPCKRCLENNWKFEPLPDNFYRATCQMCSFEVEWEKKPKKQLEEGDPCRHCKTPLAWHSNKLSIKRQKRAWHYCKWLKCPKCRAVYMIEAFKKMPDEQCDCKRS